MGWTPIPGIERAHRSGARGVGSPSPSVELAAVLTAALLMACAGAEPSTTPSVPPSAAPATLPAVSQGPSPRESEAPALVWRQVTTIDVPASIVGIAGSAAGYVALSWPLTAWFSVDGRTWTATELPFKAGTSNGYELAAHGSAVAGGPRGFLVVGGADVAPCAEHLSPGGPPRCHVDPISWTSADGRVWRSSAAESIPADGLDLPVYTEFTRAWASGDGWDAALTGLQDGPVTRGNTQLHSPDGVTWSRLGGLPLPDGVATGDAVARHGGIAAADGRRLAWQVTDFDLPIATALSTSTDGVAWTQLTGFDGTGAVVTLGHAPEDAAGSWLLGGYVSAGDTSTVRWWLSADLRSWRSGDFPIAWDWRRGLWALERWAGHYVALGARDERCCVGAAGTWISADGTAWSEAGNEGGPAYLAGGPAGLLGVGSGEDGTAAIVLGVGLDR